MSTAFPTVALDPDAFDAELEARAILASTIGSFANAAHPDAEREHASVEVKAALHRQTVSSLRRQLEAAEKVQAEMEARERELRQPAIDWRAEVKRLHAIIAAAVEGRGLRYKPAAADADHGRVLDDHGNDLRPAWRWR
jgi:hypothetical protein